jgi:hypothetical protein
MLFFSQFEDKSIEESTNDILFVELCREVSDVEGVRLDEHGNDLYSKILKDLSENHEILKNEFDIIKKNQQNHEKSLTKPESVSTDVLVNQQNLIERFSANNAHERYLHNMNAKLQNLLKVIKTLLSDRIRLRMIS